MPPSVTTLDPVKDRRWTPEDVSGPAHPRRQALVSAAVTTRPVSAAQGYLTSSPVTARPMIIRWISEVPSKIVKLLGVAAGD